MVGVDTLAFQGEEAGRTAVQQYQRLFTGQCDAGLQAAAASECITGTGKRHCYTTITVYGHRAHQTSVVDSRSTAWFIAKRNKV
jgi:hypothetical protein